MGGEKPFEPGRPLGTEACRRCVLIRSGGGFQELRDGCVWPAAMETSTDKHAEPAVGKQYRGRNRSLSLLMLLYRYSCKYRNRNRHRYSTPVRWF